jgi:hypothetical protein
MQHSRVSNDNSGPIASYMFSESYPALGASHSPSFNQRFRPETFFTAMATALAWPTSTTSRLPRVNPQRTAPE